MRQNSQINLTANTGDGPRLHVLKVVEIEDAANILVEVDGKQHRLTDQERTQIIPRCFAYSGAHDGRGDSSYTYIAFEAPPHIRIDRVRSGSASPARKAG